MANSGSFNTGNFQGRYLKFSWQVQNQSIENNQTTISWNLKGAGNAQSGWYLSGNFKVVINGQQVYYSSNRIKLYNGTQVASGQFVINHDNNGNANLNASAEAGIYTYAVNCRGNGSWSLPQIPRYPTITSAPNFNDEQNPTIQFQNLAKIYSLRAKIEAGGNAQLIVRDLDKSATSCTFNLTTNERNKLRELAKNSNTLSVRFTICAMNGNTELSASFVDKTMTIINANPTIQSISYKDTNTKTTAITEDNSIIIRNNSQLQFTFNNLNAYKYATLSNVSVNINGTIKTANLSGTSGSSKTLDFGVVNMTSDTDATIILKDSRGFTATYTQKIKIWDWQLPYATIKCNRLNNFYTQTELKVDGMMSSLNNKNELTIQYRYIQDGGSSWSDYKTIANNTLVTFDIDNNYDWTVQVVVADKLGSTTYIRYIEKGIPIMFIDRKMNAVSVNGFPVVKNGFSANNYEMGIYAAWPLGDGDDLDGKGWAIQYMDGRAEEMDFVIVKTTVNQKWGNMYISSTFKVPAYPYSDKNYDIPFISRPSVTMNVQNLSNDNLVFLVNGSGASKESAGNVAIASANAINDNTTFLISYHAVGMWKNFEYGEIMTDYE